MKKNKNSRAAKKNRQISQRNSQLYAETHFFKKEKKK